MNRFAATVLGSFCLLFGFTSRSAAQCHEWSADMGTSGAISGLVYHVAVWDDGQGPKAYAVGDFNTPIPGTSFTSKLMRFDGRDWTPLVDPTTVVHALAVFDAGSGPKLFVGGQFTSIGGTPANNVAYFDGVAWHALGTGTDDYVDSMSVVDYGGGSKLVVGGNFQAAGGAPARHIATWDGTAWAALGSGLNGTPLAFATYDSGSGPELIAGGFFTEAGGVPASRLARWNGSSWAELGGGVNYTGTPTVVRALRVFDDGSGPALFVAGVFDSAGGATASGFARWNGTSFSALAAGFHWGANSAQVQSLVVHDDGSGPALYAGGFFDQAGSQVARGIARWDGSQWQSIGDLLLGSAGLGAGDVLDMTTWDDGHGAGLLVVGYFERAGGLLRRNAALWRANHWDPVGSDAGLYGAVHATAVFDDGTGPALYCGGWIQYASGGVPCANIARWDGSSFQPVPGGVEPTANSYKGIRALLAWDDGSGPALYVGGPFATAGGLPIPNLARWNGTTWSKVGTQSPNGQVTSMAIFDDGTGPALYAAGWFSQIGGVAVRNIAKWNGTTWSPLGQGLESLNSAGIAVHALAVYDDGSGAQLYAGGAFLNAGTILCPYLARWNGTTWSQVGGGLFGTYISTFVSTLSVVDTSAGSKLMVAGTFQDAGPSGATNYAQWDGTWSPPPWAASGTVFDARLSFDAGDGLGRQLYGARIVAGAATVARWDGTQVIPVPGGELTNEPIGYASSATTFASFDDGQEPGADLYVGGSFTHVGGRPSWSMARWRACGEVGATTCFGDGSTTACPCGNASAVGDRAGCLNSSGAGASLRGSGESSVSNDTVQLAGAGMPDGPVLYFQGSQLVTPVVFGDGLRCTGGPFVRLGIRINTGGESTFPPASSAPLSTLGFVAAPITRHYQMRFRDSASFCTSATFGYSNALSLAWRP